MRQTFRRLHSTVPIDFLERINHIALKNKKEADSTTEKCAKRSCLRDLCSAVDNCYNDIEACG